MRILPTPRRASARDLAIGAAALFAVTLAASCGDDGPGGADTVQADVSDTTPDDDTVAPTDTVVDPDVPGDTAVPADTAPADTAPADTAPADTAPTDVDLTDVEAVDRGLACAPAPAALALEWRCRADSDCPCGSHCGLGLCTYDCLAHAECPDDGLCDRFGRCRDAATVLTSPPLAVPPQRGRLVVPREPVVLEDAAVTVSLAADGEDVGPVNVFAGTGVRVTCVGQPGGPAARCSFPAVDLDDVPRRVEITIDPNAALPVFEDGAASAVQIFSASDSVEIPVIALTDDAALAAPTLPGLAAGLYEGFARPAADGLDLPDDHAFRRLRVPLAATVHGDHVIALADRSSAVIPGGQLLTWAAPGGTPADGADGSYLLRGGPAVLLAADPLDSHTLDVVTGPFEATLSVWASDRLEATLALPLGPHTAPPAETLVWDFEDGTLQGWTFVHNDASNGYGVGTSANDVASDGEDWALEPAAWASRDATHDRVVARSPAFLLDPSEDIVVRIMGGQAAGAVGSGFYPADVDGLAATSAAGPGQRKLGVAVRRVSDGAYVRVGQRQTAAAENWEAVTLSGVGLSGYAFEAVTIDVYDTLEGSWGWFAIDSVRVGGRLVDAPAAMDAVDAFGTRWDIVLTRVGDLPDDATAPATPTALQAAWDAGLAGLAGVAPPDRPGPTRDAATAYVAPNDTNSATVDRLLDEDALACAVPAPDVDRVELWRQYGEWLCKRPGGLGDKLKAEIHWGLIESTIAITPDSVVPLWGFTPVEIGGGLQPPGPWDTGLVDWLCEAIVNEAAGRAGWPPGVGYVPCRGTFRVRVKEGALGSCCPATGTCANSCVTGQGCESFDFCDEVDAALREAGEPGCLDVGDQATRRLVFNPPISLPQECYPRAFGLRADVAGANKPYNSVNAQVDVTVTGGCYQPDGATSLLSPRPLPCAEGLLCATDPASYQAGAFATVVDAATQELACADDATSVGGTLVGLFDATAPTGAEALDACISDLAAPISATTPLGTAFAFTTCISKGRVLAALDHALAGVDGRAMADPAAARLAHELLRQWLGVQAFVAHELRGQAELDQVLAAAGNNPCDFDFDGQLESLAASIDAWDVLLHPNQTDALRSPRFARALLDPDPRPDHSDSALTGGPPPGLPVAMAETLRAQAESLAYFVRRGHLADAACQVEADFVAAWEAFAWRASLALALMRTLAEHAANAAAPDALPWRTEWETAFARAVTAARSLDAAVSAFASGSNPLGIEDEDLPLYFQGNETTAQERFGAVSAFLVGVDPLDAALAQDYVAGAQQALTAARDAWIARADRSILARRAESDLDGRLEDIRRRFGTPIWDACGLSQGSVLEVLDQDVDPRTCFMEPGCAWSPADQAERASADNLTQRLCMVSRLRRFVGDGVTTGSSELDAIADDLFFAGTFAVFPPFDPQWSIVPLAVAGGVDLHLRAANNTPLHVFELRRLVPARTPLVSLTLPDGVSPQRMHNVQTYCRAAHQRALSQRPATAPASCATSDDCPFGMVCDGGACGVSVDALGQDDASCFRGTLGEMELRAGGALIAARAARQRLAEYTDAYDIAMRSCILLEMGQQKQAEALAEHNDTMTALGAGKLAADITANVAEGTKDCVSTTNESGLGGLLSGGGTAAAACGAAAVEQVANSVSDGLQFAMDEAQREHDALIQSLQATTDKLRCWNDAELHMVGARSAALDVEKAMKDYAVASLELKNAQGGVADLLREGRLALQNELGRAVPPLEHDLWLDEKVDRFHRIMRLARRMSYLAVRAVEYEFQYSAMQRGQVIAAAHPDVLEAVLDSLKAQILTGGIGGAKPALSPPTVVSLKDHILQLGDRTGAPEWTQNMTPTERFHALLTSPRFAVYDQDGAYLGQRIPFSVAPIGVFELGNETLAPIFSTFSCAERLWSVNVGLPGADRLDGRSFTNVLLEQRNTFYSQRCSAAGGDDEPLWVASVRPARNLFADPLVDGDAALNLTASTSDYADPTSDVAVARIAARAATRAELEAEGAGMVPGQSEELASRALYGDYALFFPQGELDGYGSPGGLRLHELEDVLIRFYYVSVAD